MNIDDKNAARIRYQILIEGDVQLDSPLLIGNGQDDNEPEQDIHVLKNQNDIPFIPGTSITGTLRHMMEGENKEAADILFGHIERENLQNSLQSAIIVSDVLLEDTEIIVRDGVCIDAYTRTAKKGQKYNYEAIERSTKQHPAKGKLNILVTIREYQIVQLPEWKQIVQSLVKQLAFGIRIGALTSKGFGRISVPNIQAYFYDMTTFADVKKWLMNQHSERIYTGTKEDMQPVGTFVVTGHFALKTSLLVRSSEITEEDRKNKIHAVPIQSGNAYLIPGTSVKGVLRHQAAYILRMTGKDTVLEKEFADLMGYADSQKSKKSRFLTDEIYISQEYVKAQKQTRNVIDRFTGGTIDSKLFAEKPLWQENTSRPSITLQYTIHKSQGWERGLALFLLKDLWTGNTALGGDMAVGRGYLQGLDATIRYYKDKDTVMVWKIADNGNVVEGNANELETFASALLQYQGKENEK